MGCGDSGHPLNSNLYSDGVKWQRPAKVAGAWRRFNTLQLLIPKRKVSPFGTGYPWDMGYPSRLLRSCLTIRRSKSVKIQNLSIHSKSVCASIMLSAINL